MREKDDGTNYLFIQMVTGLFCGRQSFQDKAKRECDGRKSEVELRGEEEGGRSTEL